MKMNKTNMRLHSLHKINRMAKQFARLKQKAYDAGEHQSCRKYKAIQQQLYLLKSFTLLDLKEQGKITETNRCVDDNGCFLNTFISADGYVFHEISAHQEAAEGETLERVHNKPADSDENLLYLPYANALARQLPQKYRAVYDLLAEQTFSLNGLSYSERCFEALDEAGIKAEILNRTYGWYYSVCVCELFHCGVTLCKIKIFISDDLDYFLNCENGSLEFEDSFDALPEGPDWYEEA